MTRAFVGLGSNLGQPIAQVKLAIDALNEINDTALVAVSSLYRSKPMGPQNQPDYVNAVAELSTQLPPLQLLVQLQHIEQTQGRERKGERWGPRTLDLDMLLYGDVVMNTPTLTIPHYGLEQRVFVVQPLAEIAPQLVLPNGVSISSLLTQFDARELEILV